MKQIIPFILIAMIVGGALFLLQDDYGEETYNPIVEVQAVSTFLRATFFLEEGEKEGEYDLGVAIRGMNDEWQIEGLEFFFHSPYGSLNYQNLEIEDFAGEIIYTEPCLYCSFDMEGTESNHDLYADLIVNWKESGYTRTDHLYAPLDFKETINN